MMTPLAADEYYIFTLNSIKPALHHSNLYLNDHSAVRQGHPTFMYITANVALSFYLFKQPSCPCVLHLQLIHLPVDAMPDTEAASISYALYNRAQKHLIASICSLEVFNIYLSVSLSIVAS